MYGAILGDMVGAPYEFDRGNKTKDFPLFSRGSEFTDDSVMTLAVSEALLSLDENVKDGEVYESVIKSMQEWGRKYPYAGYGGNFRYWLEEKEPKPYGSFGNGSAMRVSSVGWLYDTLDQTRRYARLTAEVTHNHPEGIKGAEATASAIFMARRGASKQKIKEYIVNEFGYDLSRTCDEIRPTYHHVESCQETVPEAITAFLEGQDFVDVIRTAVSLGGDSDTLTCIAGAMAEAFYGVPEDLKKECRKRLPEDLLHVLDTFDQTITYKVKSHNDPFLVGNEQITDAISAYYENSTKETLAAVLDAIRQRMHADGHIIIPVMTTEEEQPKFTLQTLNSNDGKIWYAAFTSKEEYEKGEPSQVISHFIDSSIKFFLHSKEDTAGVVVNPWGEQSFLLANELMEKILAADEGVEYSIPDNQITAELLEDGSFLKKAVEIYARNRTQLNLIKLARILHDSYIWIPCNQIMDDEDYANMEKLIKDAEAGEGVKSIVGMELSFNHDIRFVPDILKNGEGYYFPVFTTAEEMGEYGQNFSKIQRHFLEAMNLAKNNKRDVSGIVINAFSESLTLPRDAFDLIASMDSSIEETEV